MAIRCPNCGSSKTNRSPTSDLRGITYRECEECGYNGKWTKFRTQNQINKEIKPQILRCKDEKHRPGYLVRTHETKFWCPHARGLRVSDPQWMNYTDGRSENWAKICDKSGKNATWNKKCDVEEMINQEVR